MSVPIKAALAGGVASAVVALSQAACADLSPRELIDELKRISEIEGYEFSWDGIEEIDGGIRLNGYQKTVETEDSIHQASAEWMEFSDSGNGGVSIRFPADVELVGSLRGGGLNHAGNIETTGISVVASRDTDMAVEARADKIVQEGILSSPTHGPFGAIRSEIEGFSSISMVRDGAGNTLDTSVKIDAESFSFSLQGVGVGDMVSALISNLKMEVETVGGNSHFLLEGDGPAFRWVDSETRMGGSMDVVFKVGSSRVLEAREENASRSELQVTDVEGVVSLGASGQYPASLESGSLEIEVSEGPEPTTNVARVQAAFSGVTIWETLLLNSGLSEVFDQPVASLEASFSVRGPEHLFDEDAAAVSVDQVDGPVTIDIGKLAIGFDRAVASATGSMEFPDFSAPDPLDLASASLTVELKGVRALIDRLRAAELLDIAQYIGATIMLGMGDEVEDDVLLFRIEMHGRDQLTVNGMPVRKFL